MPGPGTDALWPTTRRDGPLTYPEDTVAMSPSLDVVTQATRTLHSTHPALRHLLVEGAGETLIISGTVTCYYHKQLAQEALRPIRGDLQLVNHITVHVS